MYVVAVVTLGSIFPSWLAIQPVSRLRTMFPQPSSSLFLTNTKLRARSFPSDPVMTGTTMCGCSQAFAFLHRDPSVQYVNMTTRAKCLSPRTT
ncbi:hypothetical protein BC826DRAFT_1018258 [Russula brevipes]|nr:hypothetical protein BC826DRAFT_1018258 [Russula brevipes]